MAIKEDETITYSNMYNEATNKSQLKHEIISSAYNHKYIISAVHEGRAYDISEEPKVNKIPAIIFGSGASLDKSLPYLKDWKGGTFCTTSHAESLIRFGVEPTYIIDLDPICPWSDISDIDWSKTKTKLVLHPGVYPDLVEHWPNKMLLYLENSGDPMAFYSTTQPIMYTERIHPELATRDQPLKRLIVTNFSIFACSPPLELFVAHLLGYDPIFTCGIDFAFTFDKERFTNWKVKKEYLKDTGIDPRKDQYTEEEWGNMWYPIEHPLPALNENDIIITSNGLKAKDVAKALNSPEITVQAWSSGSDVEMAVSVSGRRTDYKSLASKYKSKINGILLKIVEALSVLPVKVEPDYITDAEISRASTEYSEYETEVFKRVKLTIK